MIELLTSNAWAITKIVLGSIFIFALIRELICWYFKINQRIALLEDIKRELQKSNFINMEKL